MGLLEACVPSCGPILLPSSPNTLPGPPVHFQLQFCPRDPPPNYHFHLILKLDGLGTFEESHVFQQFTFLDFPLFPTMSNSYNRILPLHPGVRLDTVSVSSHTEPFPPYLRVASL